MQPVKHILEIPSKEDWGNFDGDLDAADAYAVFFSRSNSEMQRYFAQNFMMRAQDIRFMPNAPFIYYMHGFTEFLLSGPYEGDEVDVGNCYLDIVESRMNTAESALYCVSEAVLKGLNFIVDNPDKFGSHPEIYGDFWDRLARIENIINKLQQADQQRGSAQ